MRVRGAVPPAGTRERARRRGGRASHRARRRTSSPPSARARGLGEARVFDSVHEMAGTSMWSRSSTPTRAAVAVMEEIAAAVGDGARLRGLICEKPLARNLPEGAPGDGARERDRRADRLFRESDPHEDAAAGTRAARRVGGGDGTAHAGASRRGARRAAQRVVLGSHAARRRRALRHGLPQHRGRPLPAHARRADRSRTSSRKPCRRT